MSKQTVTGSIFDGLNRKSGETESNDQVQIVSLPPSAKTLESFPVDQIFLGTNVRKIYTNLDELAKSINENGLLEPIGIERDPDPKTGKRKLVYGHRRFKAISEILKWSAVKAVLVDSKQTETAEQRSIVQLIENIQREDIPDSDLAISLKEIKSRLNLSNSELAKKFSKSESWIKAKIDHSSLLEKGLPADLPTSFLNETKGLPDKKRIELLEKAFKGHWTRAKLRDEVTSKKGLPADLRTPISKTAQNRNREVSPKDKIKSLQNEIKALESQLKAKKNELAKLSKLKIKPGK